MDKYLNANQARRQSLKNVKAENYPELDAIMKQIQKAINKGEFIIALHRNNPLPPEIVLKLKTLNYRVEQHKRYHTVDPEVKRLFEHRKDVPVEDLTYWEKQYFFNYHIYISWKDSKEFYEK